MSSSPSEGQRVAAVGWSEPPRDVLILILQKLVPEEILGKAHNVCKTWRDVISSEPSFWRSISTCDFHGGGRRKSIMTKKAVDYSSGQLIRFRSDSVSSVEVLPYMADRASGLRHLEVSGLDSVRLSLVQVVKKLPLLEELQISEFWLLEEDIETIGTCCPRIRSLILGNTLSLRPDRQYDDKEALVFGRSMSGLQNLQICGDKLTDAGLQAILDGCPRIQSLSLLITGNCRETITSERRSSRIEMVHFLPIWTMCYCCLNYDSDSHYVYDFDSD